MAIVENITNLIFTPGGSYLETSKSVNVTINAFCAKRDGSIANSAPLSYTTEQAQSFPDIANDNGNLVSQVVSPGTLVNEMGIAVPAGSYQKTSSEIVITLSALCQKINGTWVNSTLTYSASEAQNYPLGIVNNDGNLSFSMSSIVGATTINIAFQATGCQTYLNNVTGLIIGNMVAPCGGGFWYNVSSATWTWNNDGTNVNAFGLMGNYQFSGEEETAYGMIVIDPTQLAPGTYDVLVTLSTAQIGPGNNILMFQGATVNGKPSATVFPCTYPGQSSAEFYTC
ncbi:hypothetical protein FNW52_10850 [Flavobacterium sp. ZT3R18]|uniref:hypothetical protein n=1 Tax=Flavobacterium sp. ZT3R18 TaxID=2594429 RepID=UPI00117B80F2|nr:hypothetical protein [Flavobacterium sp. ZT3R18]TRX35530.1 hypothetical protein FNW52_10850 [Flavobacterium sp. ZT3R18]